MISYESLGETGYVCSIFKEGEFLGFLSVYEAERKLQEEEKHFLRLVCNIVAVRMSEGKGNIGNNGTFGALLTNLVEGKIESEASLDRIMALNNRKKRPYYRVIRMEPQSHHSAPPIGYVLGRLSSLCVHIISAEYQGGVLTLVDASTRPYLDEVCEMLFSQVKQLKWKICVSDVFSDLLEMPIYYAQTVRLARIDLETGRNSVLFFSDYRVADLLLEIKQKTFYQQYYNDAVTTLEDHDHKNGTMLSKTLSCYLRSGQSVTKCSRELDLHKNTVASHLEKIREITSSDLTDPDELFHMFLTYQMKQHYQE